MAGPVCTEADYAEIIAESLDPDAPNESEGRPLTPERRQWLEEFADALFRQRTIEKQVAYIRVIPLAGSVRRLSRMTGPEQAEILSRLPADLAAQLRAQLPVGVN